MQLCVKPAITLRRRTPRPLIRHHSHLFSDNSLSESVSYLLCTQSVLFMHCEALTYSRFVLPWRSDWQQQHWELPLLSGFGKASAKLSSVHHLSPKGRRPLPVHSLQQIIQLIWKKEKRSIRCVFSLFIFSYTLQEFHNSAVAAWTQSNLCELNPLLIFPKN